MTFHHPIQLTEFIKTTKLLISTVRSMRYIVLKGRKLSRISVWAIQLCLAGSGVQEVEQKAIAVYSSALKLKPVRTGPQPSDEQPHFLLRNAEGRSCCSLDESSLLRLR